MTNNNFASLNLTELEILLRLLNKQEVKVDNNHVHFIDNGRVATTFEINSLKKSLEQVVTNNVLAIAKEKMVVDLALGSVTSASRNKVQNAVVDNYKTRNFQKVFEVAYNHAPVTTRKYCKDNTKQFRDVNLDSAINTAEDLKKYSNIKTSDNISVK